jgi:NADH:ubiquinone oxidoreductase subunit 4 (subunit M)
MDDSLHLKPVSGAAHGHHDDHAAEETGSYPTHEGQLDSSRWLDLNLRESLTLFPLAALTIFFGVYPKPLLAIMEPSLQAILDGALRVVGN